MYIYVLCEQPFDFDQGDAVEDFVLSSYENLQSAIEQGKKLLLDGDDLEIEVIPTKVNTWLIQFVNDEPRYTVKKLTLEK